MQRQEHENSDCLCWSRPVSFLCASCYHSHALRSLSIEGCTHTTHKLQQMSYISEFTTDIRHIKGVDNDVADAFSCSPVSAVTSPNPIKSPSSNGDVFLKFSTP